MRKVYFLLLVLLLGSFKVFSQEIIPFAGYMLSGSAEFYEGEIDFDNGPTFGVSFIYTKDRTAPGLELTYSHTNSQGHFISYPGFDLDEKYFDVNINYLHIGFIKGVQVNEYLYPFMSVSAGGTWMAADEYGTEWRFSTSLGAGAKIYFTKRIGIFMRARLLIPMQFVGAGGWCGIGSGGPDCGLSVNSYSTIVEGDFTGGLVIKLR
jgi:hypothetical protein